MRVKEVGIILGVIVAGFVLVKAIAPPESIGDKQIETTVVNRWQAADDEVVQIQVKRETTIRFINISKAYWGEVKNPQVSDCIMVWASLYTDNSAVIHSRRNIAPCN